MSRYRSDEGAYAVLYAALVLLLFGLASLVVDLSMLRADKRDGRSTADFASLAGARDLGTGPWTPRQACDTAWSYALTSLEKSSPASPCSSWPVTQATCPSTPLTPVTATAGGLTITIHWPISSTSSLLTDPDGLASGSRTYDSSFDGSAAGCDRLGVTIRQERAFGLAAAIGFARGSSTAQSVARITSEGGQGEQVSALNVLNPTDCNSLTSTGGGQVIVGPVLNDGQVVGPGRIAVEPAGTNGCNGAGTFVIDPTGGGAQVCAASTTITTTNPCDGLGVIKSHALDSAVTAPEAYNPATSVRPVPIPLGATQSYSPVTNRYGCNTTRLTCNSPTPPFAQPTRNFVAELETALGGTDLPTPYNPNVGNYNTAVPAADNSPFSPVPATVCDPLTGNSVSISGPVILLPGNWYAPCAITIRNGGTLIIPGGTLVAQSISIDGGGCFVMNTAVSTCPTASNPSYSGAGLTTPTLPLRDAIVFLRNGSIVNNSSLVMPQTLVYSRPGTGGGNPPNALIVNNSSGGFTLWTAPGGGPRDPTTGLTLLEQRCYDVAAAAVDQDCMNSRFARVAYWSDYAAVSTGNPGPNNFNGQGSLNVAGIFFTPKGYFSFAGGSCYTAAAAQFWGDKIRVVGQSCLLLSPDEELAAGTPEIGVKLIR